MTKTPATTLSEQDPAQNGAVAPVNLPSTRFPMRGNLDALEPLLIERWGKIDLWQQIRQTAKGRKRFILHDGPPYANGNIHLGTALNKILKDIISRSQNMLGRDAHYVPGWDCHGLPIEWKVEEGYRKQGRDKKNIPVEAFRKECRQFALKWLEIQKKEFQRLGVIADWGNPYLTMSFAAEAKIAEEITTFIKKGLIYRSQRPVLWSIVEQTALAEAEVEYKSVKSKAIYVCFPIDAASPRFSGHHVVIWTTTPWTIPANRILACHHELNYVSLTIDDTDDDSMAAVGMRLIVAESLAESVAKNCGIRSYTINETFSGKEFEGIYAHHPLHNLDPGYTFRIPITTADFVDSAQGTGIVHIAPSHGPDDFELGRRLDVEPVPTVAKDGTYTTKVPLFTGLAVYTNEGKPGPANDAVIQALKDKGHLIGLKNYKHDYPHSWRSKTPLIYRLTHQWFVSLDKPAIGTQVKLRDKALEQLQHVKFHPEAGRDRLSSMVRLRPDWCISRQRTWGVPLPLFVNRETDEVLADQDVFDRVIAQFKQHGADAWFTQSKHVFLGEKYDPDQYDMIADVVDVWFDSGSTHAFVLEGNPNLSWPADLYLEGSDQHRGWFQSSLLQSVGTRERVPFKAIMTHGFVVDKNGEKLSKSLGNYLSIDKLLATYGAELLRLWIASADVFEDIRFSDAIMKQQRDVYRRIRNTLRWMLGILHDEKAPDISTVDDLPGLEKLILHRLSILTERCQEHANNYTFNSYMRELFNFCNEDLSAFYFDIRKDLLYCGDVDDPQRRASLAVLGIIFDRVCRLCSPILCFTAEEAWLTLHGDHDNISVHTQTLVETPWQNHKLEEQFSDALFLRSAALQCLDKARKEGLLRSSLVADLHVYTCKALDISEEELAALCIVSQAQIHNEPPSSACTGNKDMGVILKLADGMKCPRCWRVLKEIHKEGDICQRCASVQH